MGALRSNSARCGIPADCSSQARRFRSGCSPSSALSWVCLARR
jgi:hypothetical protein